MSNNKRQPTTIVVSPAALKAFAAMRWVNGERVPHAHDDPTAFADFIKRRLREVGMTRDEFADALAINRSTIYRLFGSNAPATLESQRILAIANVLSVPTSMLVVLWRGQLRDFASEQRNRMMSELQMDCLSLSNDQACDVLMTARGHAAQLRATA